MDKEVCNFKGSKGLLGLQRIRMVAKALLGPKNNTTMVGFFVTVLIPRAVNAPTPPHPTPPQINE